MSPIYVALDLETTGLNPARDAIIEVGAVKFDNQRELGEFRSLVNPGRPIPLQITQLTSITNQDVVTAPPFSALREKLARFVGTAIVVGHNVGFDLRFLQQNQCSLQNPSVDTFALAAILMPHEGRYSLGKLTESLGIDSESQHRALDDARASMRLFQAMQERAADLPRKTLRTINQATRQSRWPLRSFFQEAERTQAQGLAGNTIGAQLRAKGLIGDVAMLVQPPPEKPLMPVDRRTALDSECLAAMLQDGGALAKAFPGFEYRPQQVEMMQAVADAFNQSRHLLVEAGTGTGKSIAYLLPAVHWAVQNGECVVVSTNTINLQDQLYSKDIPDLRSLLPFEVRATVLKGRSNYLCMRRLEAMQDRRDLDLDELNLLAKVLVWVSNTVTGDRAELFLPEQREREIWDQISSNTNTCSADRCPYRRQGTCFFYRARQAAESAHIIVVNHALLLSDVATENRVLPRYSYLIVDEAHHLEDATTYQLGYTLTDYRVRSLIDQVGREEGAPGGYLRNLLSHCEGKVSPEMGATLQESVALLYDNNQRLIHRLDGLFEALTVFVAGQGGDRGQYDYRIRLSRSLRISAEWEQIELVWDGFAEPFQTLVDELTRLIDLVRELEGAGIPRYDDLLQDGIGLLRQVGTIYAQMDSILAGSEPDAITWVQTRAQPSEISLCAVPLRVGHLVQEHLLWSKEAVIMTSATLCTNGDFSFIKERLGAHDAEELAVGSPFDYEAQVLLYLPTDIPEPNQPYHQKMLNEALVALAQATKGRMLALFTSYSQLQAVNNAINRPLAQRGVTVYAQGQGTSRSQLLENFRTSPRAVLLGTRSFWEGIDVPGEALSCLVLVKLPFAVPSDPVFAARSEDVDDPFYQYAVPDAILRFRQGFGRLIRTKVDRGIVVVMDRRVQTKRYGELFLQSLPLCTTVNGSLVDLPGQAALWIDQGIAPDSATSHQSGVGDQELEYVSFDDI